MKLGLCGVHHCILVDTFLSDEWNCKTENYNLQNFEKEKFGGSPYFTCMVIFFYVETFLKKFTKEMAKMKVFVG